MGLELPFGPSQRGKPAFVYYSCQAEHTMVRSLRLESPTMLTFLCAHTPAHTLPCAHTHPVCVVDDNGVRVPVVGRIRIWVIAKPGQHGGNLGHIPHHVSRDVASPLGESFQVHWFDDLVRGPLDPVERGQSCQVGGRSLLGGYRAAGWVGIPDPWAVLPHQL